MSDDEIEIVAERTRSKRTTRVANINYRESPLTPIEEATRRFAESPSHASPLLDKKPRNTKVRDVTPARRKGKTEKPKKAHGSIKRKLYSVCGPPLGSDVTNTISKKKCIRKDRISCNEDKKISYEESDILIDVLPDIENVDSKIQNTQPSDESSTVCKSSKLETASLREIVKRSKSEKNRESLLKEDKEIPEICIISPSKNSDIKMEIEIPDLSKPPPSINSSLEQKCITNIDRRHLSPGGSESYSIKNDKSLHLDSSASEMSICLNDTASSFESSPLMKRLGPALVNSLSPQIKKTSRISLAKSLVKKSLAKRKSLVSSNIVKSDLSKVMKSKPKSPKCSGKTLKKVNASIDPDIEVLFEWDAASVISQRQQVDERQAKEIIKLLEAECTLPFIARYRREKTGNMEIEKLREVHNAYQQLKEVKQKVSKVLQEKTAKLSQDTKKCLLSATSIKEVKTLTQALKIPGQKTLADRARNVKGLPEVADRLLKDQYYASTPDVIEELINPAVEGKKTFEEVESGIKFIIADVISKDPMLIKFMKNGLKSSNIMLHCTQARKAKTTEKPKKVISKRKSMGAVKKVAVASKTTTLSPEVISKYETYFDFHCSAWSAKPHAILAMNRGEQQGVLSIKIEIPGFAYSKFIEYCNNTWIGILQPDENGVFTSPYRRKFLLHTVQDCWERLLQPCLQTWVRSELSDTAELASIEVFSANLRRLLLTPPVRANSVLAIDPGFANGCKVAVVERKGKVLSVDTIYPFSKRYNNNNAADVLIRLVCEYNCETVCIGNGTACRETEAWLSKLIQQKRFGSLNVQYTIINESGASQYSVTDEAKSEFPDMDINHISAVSLARRLQDPLLEYVKVPPMHLGVGMYQHDVSKKLLTSSLDAVIMECVSFVGVDLNVASEVILRKVSGLNKSRASAIVKHREEHGTFRNREELRKVKGIGPISFQQCAGFVRIVPQTLRQSSKNPNLSQLCTLDSTTVHPESYDIAETLIKAANLKVSDVGTSEFISALKKFVYSRTGSEICRKCNCSEATLQCILESLYQPLDFDFRAQFEKPLFRKGVTSIEDLKPGEMFTGSVRNVTPFGAFVDIGVGVDGLIHVSKMQGEKLQLGNTVEVKITNVEVSRKRIGLFLEKLVG